MKLNIHKTYNPVIKQLTIIHGHLAQRNENVYQIKTCIWMFRVTLLITAQTWNKTRVSFNEQILFKNCGTSIPWNTTQQCKRINYRCTHQFRWIWRDLCWMKKASLQRLCYVLFLWHFNDILEKTKLELIMEKGSVIARD